MTTTQQSADWIERIEQAIADSTTPRMLPVLVYQGEEFFVDARLREFRKVSDPGCMVRFRSSVGEEMIAGTWLTCCPFCRQAAVTTVDAAQEYVTCRRCGRTFPGDLE